MLQSPRAACLQGGACLGAAAAAPAPLLPALLRSSRLRILPLPHKSTHRTPTRAVTHIVCSNLPDAKVKQLQKERSPTPIVRPEWIVDCIKAGRLLPVSGGLLWGEACCCITLVGNGAPCCCCAGGSLLPLWLARHLCPSSLA